MPDPTPMEKLLTEVIGGTVSLVTWGLVVGGWFFVRKDNKEREDRRDLRNSIDSITIEILDLQKCAYDYYCMDQGPNAELLELEMKRRQAALEKRVERLKRPDYHFHSVAELSDYAKRVTGGTFELATRQKVPVKDRKLLEISSAANDLIGYLEAEYDALYTHKGKMAPKP
jgi:hypothetical protein